MAADFSLFVCFVALILLLFSLLVLCGCVYLVYIHNRYSHLPGPRRSSFILGNIPEVRRYHKDGKIAYEYFLDMFEIFGPVFVLFVAYRPLVFITDPLYIKKIFVESHVHVPKSKSVYEKVAFVYGERALGYGLVTNRDRTSWLRRRQTINPAFHRHHLKNLMNPFNQVCDKLSTRLTSFANEGREVGMLKELGNAVLDVIGQVAFGVHLGTIEDPNSPFQEAINRMFQGIEDSIRKPFPSWFLQVHQYSVFQSEVQRSQIDAIKFIRSFARKCIAERLSAVQDGVSTDVLSHILKLPSDDSSITMEDLVDEFVTLFVAGYETTASSLALTLFEVISNPEIEQNVLDEIEEVIGGKERVDYEDLARLKYVGQCVMEGLRKFMIASGPNRLLTKDVTVGGFTIPRGCSIAVNKYALCRSATFWKKPDVFDPTRFSSPADIPNFRYVFMPFSLGPRNCIGQTFTMFEQKVVLARLIQSFKFRLLPGQTSTIVDRSTLTSKDGVRCTVECR